LYDDPEERVLVHNTEGADYDVRQMGDEIVFLATVCSLASLEMANAQPVTKNICIGDVGFGKCFPRDVSFDCAFARARNGAFRYAMAGNAVGRRTDGIQHDRVAR